MTDGYETVVLEGCGGVGKSTLAERLGTHHRFAVVHSPRTPDHLDLASRYRTILAGKGRILFDRCFISELVYGPLHRGRSRINWTQAIDLASEVARKIEKNTGRTYEPNDHGALVRTSDA